MKKKKIFFLLLSAIFLLLALCFVLHTRTVKLSKSELMDKIKGGWAGQTIGCAYGGPTEFCYRGVMIPDETPIVYPEHHLQHFFDRSPGLYDDIYMDLTFVNVLSRLGLDAPVDSVAHAYAYAPYPLWHANQAARYNIQHGILPPASGHWRNNPHADCIDYQIEADYAGLMSPAMPNAASALSNRIGHIMNYGDGWYGGVFVGAMYALAFVENDVEAIVTKALKTIPRNTKFYRCLSDVIRWYKEDPTDWKRAWQLYNERWSDDVGCPELVLAPGNIDATMNSAYVAIGLLFGQGDFGRTLEISTRCGQDSDCNPSTAGGVLATMLGYSRIPEEWMPNVREVENRPFAYTDISLSSAYSMTYELALQQIIRNGGRVSDDAVRIKAQKPRAVQWEQGFPDMHPVLLTENVLLSDTTQAEPLTLSFEGKGIAVYGQLSCPDKDYSAELEVSVDGKTDRVVNLPADFLQRTADCLYWNYNLPEGSHTVSFRLLNPRSGAEVRAYKVIRYLSDSSVQEANKEDVLQHVNLFIGTANDYGQMAPGACMPYSQIQVSPDSKPRQHPGYDYEVARISGFSINRLSGVGGSGCGGNVSLMPDATGTDVQLLKSTEQASPGYYGVQLTNGVSFAATADRRMAIERFTFPSPASAVLLLNPSSAFDRVHSASFRQTDDCVGQGYIDCANTCGRGSYHLHYRLFSSAPFALEEQADGMKKLSFPSLTDNTVEIRIVVSTGLAQELDALPESDVWRTTFDEKVVQAREAWRQLLSAVEVEGGSADERTLFYTSLYRTFHSPFQVTDSTMRHYLGTDGSVHEARDFTYYSSWSLWDTYRTKFPLITLLDAQRSADIMQSLATLYMTGKKDWSTAFECVPTVRTEHAVATLLDAYRQGVSIPNLREAYPGMTKEVEGLSLKSPDQCLEAAGDFWALGQLAQELGIKDDAARWTRRGEEIFDSIWPQEFQTIDSSFVKMRGNGLYQGTRWQYRWGAPMYLNRMTALVGKKELAHELLTFFEQQLYNQGNEPDIHVPFLFGRLGMPAQTGLTVRPLATEVVTHRYGGNDAYPVPWEGCAFVNAPRGYAPEMDEDDGAMSAWYVFASMGLYPLVVGEAQYEVFSPLFDKVTLHLNGNDVVISTQGRKDVNQPLKSVTWNGKRLRHFQISVSELKKGGKLVMHY